MSNLYYYILLNPLHIAIRVTDVDVPDESVTVQGLTDRGSIVVEFFLSKSKPGMLSHFRIIFVNHDDEELSDREWEKVHKIKEIVLGALRMTYSSMVTFYPLAPQITKEHDIIFNLPELSISDEFTLEAFKVNLACGFYFQDDFMLLSESYARYYPIMYRYLSLFKIFDRYADNDKKNTKELLKRYLGTYSGQYNKLSLSRSSIENYAMNLRDRCAHSIVGKSNHGSRQHIRSDVIELEKFTDNIMQRATIDLLNDEFEKQKDSSSLGLVKLHWLKPPGFVNI